MRDEYDQARDDEIDALTQHRRAMGVNAAAQQAGFVAGSRGDPHYANPYSATTGKGRAWARGWQSGRGVYVLNTPAHLIRPAAGSALGWLAFWVFVVPVAVALVVVVASFFW